MSEKTHYSISELASMLEISPSTIRFYEEKKLIDPDRTSGNQRIYSRKDRARLKLILRGKRFGFSLDEIAEIIGLADMEVNETSQIEKSLAYADKRISEIRTRRNELDLLETDMLAMKDNLLNRLEEIQK
ncbi:MAG: MerR family DNA-binding transcriptional regulator [Desulfobacteraceae bacterium]|jgi:DNA-binding transcriptional MerR regulator